MTLTNKAALQTLSLLVENLQGCYSQWYVGSLLGGNIHMITSKRNVKRYTPWGRHFSRGCESNIAQKEGQEMARTTKHIHQTTVMLPRESTPQHPTKACPLLQKGKTSAARIEARKKHNQLQSGSPKKKWRP